MQKTARIDSAPGGSPLTSSWPSTLTWRLTRSCCLPGAPSFHAPFHAASREPRARALLLLFFFFFFFYLFISSTRGGKNRAWDLGSPAGLYASAFPQRCRSICKWKWDREGCDKELLPRAAPSQHISVPATQLCFCFCGEPSYGYAGWSIPVFVRQTYQDVKRKHWRRPNKRGHAAWLSAHSRVILELSLST